MKKFCILSLTILLSVSTQGQTTAIPDANFEQALIDLGYDTGTPDGSVPTVNINTITYLPVASKSISDLTGIADFAALTGLDCSDNQLTTLDLTQNTLLSNTSCHTNQLTSLDLTQHTGLSVLSVASNQLTSLDLSQNPALVFLSCGINQLTSLDVTQNPDLESLNFGDNQLTSIDLSQNIALTELRCVANQLTSLDLSLHTALNLLLCNNNQLTCLNVKNGNNTNFLSFGASYNPSLTCIEVDDDSWSTANWTTIDASTSFSTNCNNSCTVGNDDIRSSSTFLVYPNPTNGNISVVLGALKTNLTVNICDNLGQILSHQRFDTTGLLNIDIDVPPGIYFLQLADSSGATSTIKILIK